MRMKNRALSASSSVHKIGTRERLARLADKLCSRRRSAHKITERRWRGGGNVEHRKVEYGYDR